MPIVRETGGLRDTVLSYNEYTGDGNGFTFFNYNANDMLNVINRAIDYYENHKDVWQTLQQRGMTGDYSWTNSSKKYMELYEGLVSGRFDHELPHRIRRRHLLTTTRRRTQWSFHIRMRRKNP